MVTTRPMIRLSGFSRKTSFEDPTLNSSGCSFHCPNKRGSQQQLLKCDCDCEANALFRQKLLQQQQRQHQIQRNHHLLLLQLQNPNRRGPKPLPPPPPAFHQRPVYFPHPKFRPTAPSDKSESDRESLEHFHRHLQQLHRITCASLENAIYCGGSNGSGSSSGRDKKSPVSGKGTSVKSTKSFSFRDIRNIGRKKTGSSIPVLRHQNSQASPSSSSCSSSVTQSSSLSPPTSSKGAIKRRNTTRTAKDYIGVSRVKLLAKYWGKGKSSATDSGNGESTSRSSDSGESQLSNYSENGLSSSTISISNKCLLNRSNRSALTSNRGSSSTSSNTNSNANVVSPSTPHKPYPISQNNTNGSNNTVTYKVRYDIPSSWETEQLLSFASTASSDHDDYQQDHQRKHGTRSENKVGCKVRSISGDSIPCEEDQDQVRHSASCGRTAGSKTNNAKVCTHCGRGPDSGANVDEKKAIALKPKKTHILKALTFVKSQNAKPKVYSTESSGSLDKKSGKLKKDDSSEKNISTRRPLADTPSTPSPCPLSRNAPGRTMVHKGNPVGRSKSQKSTATNASKLAHTNSLLVIPSKNEFSPNTSYKIRLPKKFRQLI